MARYDHLPIYKKALELVVYIEDTVRGFSRYHKYSIGERLRQASWDTILLIVRANNTPAASRAPVLESLRERIEEVNIALAVAKELQAFANFNAFRNAAKMAIDLGRQGEGWLKTLRQPLPPES